MKGEKIRLVYDVTWPAKHYQINAMHGGLRVSLELLSRLYKNPNIHLSFGINEINAELVEILKALIYEQYRFTEKRIVNNWRSEFWEGIFSNHHFLNRIYKYDFTAYTRLLFDPRKMRSAQIYHTPLDAIPAEVKSYPHIKTVFTAHDLMPFIRPDLAPEGFYQTLKPAYDSIDRNTTIVAVSNSTKLDLLNYRPDLSADQIKVVYLAADKNIFYHNNEKAEFTRAKIKYGLKTDSYFLCLNRFQKYKNTQLVIDSYIQLVESNQIKDIALLLIGKFKNDLIKMQTLDKYKNYNIVFLEWVADDELSVLYSNCLCFIYMSLFEGFGLPVLEAMQCGAPVICSNVKSLPEVAGEAAILLNPDSIDDLCNAMLNYFNNANLRLKKSSESISRSSMFSWDKHTNEVVSLYQELV
jgi:glycosyltransferase involved in cell wall biosynthesis